MEWSAVASFATPELQDLSAYAINREGTKLILTSPRRPPLVTMLRDHVEGGGTMAEAVARARQIKAMGKIDDWWVSEQDLVTLATARRQSGYPEDSVLLLDLSAELYRNR
jgi:hypothetical protein